ncbi:hypothetical protein Tco_0173127 [Tanacetum coccineum]
MDMLVMLVHLALKLSLCSLDLILGKQNVNSGSVHVNTARVNRPVSNQTSNKTSPKLSQVNLTSPKKCFSKQSSPVNRPFSRNTAHKSNTYAVKGKMGTAVKTSACCVWRKVIPLSNTNSGPTPDSKPFDGPRYYLELERMLQAQLGHEKGHASCHLPIGCKLVVSNDVVVNLLYKKLKLVENMLSLKEEETKQIHLDALLAQRIAEEKELTEQQKKRKAQVQFEAQHYTTKDWDLIRAKIEANAELSKSMLGSNLQG